MSNLRTSLIRLAHQQPSLRPHLLPLLVRTANDHSTNETVVEYAVQLLFKKKGVEGSAKQTAESLSGGTNYFIGGGHETVSIDPKKLEGAIWDRLVQHTLKGMARMKPGKEDFAFLGTVDNFKLGKKDQKMLKALVEKAWGHKLPGDV